MWFIFAILSAISAAFVTIFAKMGLKGIDSTLATTIRGTIMAILLIAVSIALKKFEGFSISSFSSRDWILIILAAIAGALSWLFYFAALKMGDSSKVAAIDRTSILFIVFFSALFLGEKLTITSVFGAILIALGAFFVLGI